MTKWIVLSAGIVLQIVLGGIYAWSAFVPPLTNSYGLTKGQCGLIFGVMIATFALTTIPAGRLLQKQGPRLTAGIGAILFAIGYILASLSGGTYLLLLICFGVVVGAGVGFGYVCPLAVGMKWFPKNKGLITGVAVAGFGGGAILLNFLTVHLLHSAEGDIMKVFQFVGIVLGSVAVVSAMFLRDLPGVKLGNAEIESQKIRKYLFSIKFVLICLGMFAGTFSGLMVVGNLKPMMLNIGLDESNATSSIFLFAVGNVIGRILWGWVHDRLGSRKTIIMSLAFLAVALFILLVIGSVHAVLFMTLLVGVGFGGCFVVYASATVEMFGVHLFPKMYPICFLFYGLAALAGPPLGGWIADASGSYEHGIWSSIAIISISIAIIWFAGNQHGTLNRKESER